MGDTVAHTPYSCDPFSTAGRLNTPAFLDPRCFSTPVFFDPDVFRPRRISIYVLYEGWAFGQKYHVPCSLLNDALSVVVREV